MTLTATQVAEILATPVTSFVPHVDNHGICDLTRYKYEMYWGAVDDPQQITVIVTTGIEPTPELGGNLTVYYNPMCTQVLVGGKPLKDRYVGQGLYPFSYDPKDPAIIQNLAMVLNPLSNPALPAPCVTGLF
jgi:hypothetical protein